MLFPRAGVQQEISQGKGGFVELEKFEKHLVKNTRKKIPAGKKRFFLLHTVETTFQMKNFTQRCTQSGPFFPK